MKNIVLFDLDGTLTEARLEINKDTLDALASLSKHTEIGVITGSGLDYIWEQLLELQLGLTLTHVLPCNGTKYYKRARPYLTSSEQKLFDCMHSVSMQDKLGRYKYNDLIKAIIKLHIQLLDQFDIPLSGEFISYRGSMINWSPIGRAATKENRAEFVSLDNKLSIRRDFLQALRTNTHNIDVTCVLGGQTSFDIYPTGWDKSYALQHFDKYNIWFIGDKCTNDGNDRAIYDLILDYQRFETSSVNETILVINEIIKTFL